MRRGLEGGFLKLTSQAAHLGCENKAAADCTHTTHTTPEWPRSPGYSIQAPPPGYGVRRESTRNGRSSRGSRPSRKTLIQRPRRRLQPWKDRCKDSGTPLIHAIHLQPPHRRRNLPTCPKHDPDLTQTHSTHYTHRRHSTKQQNVMLQVLDSSLQDTVSLTAG